MMRCPACGASVVLVPEVPVRIWGRNTEVRRILQAVAPTPISARQLTEMLGGLVSRASMFRALKSLVDSGEVERSEVKDGTCSKPYFVYRARPAAQ
jgi:predicted transcriptional regulator